jgi:hypothetical protein
MKTQTLNLENHEVVILIITLTGMLSSLEKEYNESKNDKSFMKKEAKSEINIFKTLIKKVNKLEVKVNKLEVEDFFTL